jgi:pyruvate kinase
MHTKHTKIVATIGPATESEETLEQMVAAGMNVARFNTKHSTPDWHSERLQRVRNVSKKLKTPIGTLVDLQGPEIRIDLPDEKEFSVKSGDKVIFTSNEKHKAKNFAIVPKDVIDSLDKGDGIMLEDGLCEFTVVEKGADYIAAQALVSCTVKHRKTMNTPGVILDMPSLTDRDFGYLDKIKPELVDFVGLSFVRDALDIKVLKRELDKRSYNAHIVAKIENQAALDNLDEIIELSDVVMIARGDLGVEVPYEELIHWQKIIIEKCRVKAIPVITATQMLKSMVDSPRPTRAEVSDVAHAIYDGTDAVMLSEETTIGDYPVKAIATQAKIAAFNEPFANTDVMISAMKETSSESAITHAANGLISHANFNIDKVICLTETGTTAKLMARFRKVAPIVAISSSEKTNNFLTPVYGITSYTVNLKKESIINIDVLLEKLEKLKIVEKGEVLLVCHGHLLGRPNMTNTLRVVTI